MNVQEIANCHSEKYPKPLDLLGSQMDYFNEINITNPYIIAPKLEACPLESTQETSQIEKCAVRKII